MRKLLTPAAVLVALATPAMAFTAAPPGPASLAPEYISRANRRSTAATATRSSAPWSAWISLPDTNYHVKSFDVIHNLFSGRTINRNDQYNGTVSGRGLPGVVLDRRAKSGSPRFDAWQADPR